MNSSLSQGGQVHVLIMDLDVDARDFTPRHYPADDPTKL
jgi:hypothetical protein